MKVKTLASALDDKIQTEVYKAVQEKDTGLLSPTDDDKLNFLQYELASAYSTFLFNNGKLDKEKYRELKHNFTRTEVSSQTAIDISEFKNPLKRVEDSQVGLGYFNRESNSYLRFDLLPASHKLTDDNRQLFSESSLELGGISFLANLEKYSFSLEEFKLFSVTSLIPRDKFTGGLSGSFEMGIEQHLDQLLNNYSAGYISGGLGLSKAIHEDIFVYSMANLGAAYGRHNFYPFASPEVGIFIEEAFDMKSIGSYELVCGQNKNFPCYKKLKLSQSIYLNSHLALIMSYSRASLSDKIEHVFEAVFRNYF